MWNWYIIYMRKKTLIRIPKEKLLDAHSKLDEIINVLEPYLMAMKMPERQTLMKIGTDSLDFLEASRGHAESSPELFPVYIKKELFREELNTIHELCRFLNRINNLREDISNTETLAGNHALEVARAFFDNVRFAARRDIPGARIIYDELKRIFPYRKRKQKKAV